MRQVGSFCVRRTVQFRNSPVATQWFSAKSGDYHETKFWSPPKRCPHFLTFNAENAEHGNFVFASSILRAQMYNLKPILDRKKVVDMAARLETQKFTPKSDVRIAVTEAEASKLVDSKIDVDKSNMSNVKGALEKFDGKTTSFRLVPIDFEKDDDANHQVEFITAASNLRAENYNILKADKTATKQIAGRIIPAIATTTAAVAGLDCLELYKIVMGGGKCKLVKFKNAFINLALPYFGFAEPIAAPTKKLYDAKWSLWDGIDIQGDITLKQFFEIMKIRFY